MKIRVIAFLMAALLMLCVFAGCKKDESTDSTDTTAAVSTAAETTPTLPEPTAAKEIDTNDFDALISDVKNEMSAIKENSEDYDAAEGMSGIYEVLNSLQGENTGSIGYVTTDMNGDEAPELFIYLVDENANGVCKGSRVLAGYTYSEGEYVLLFEGNSNNRYYFLNSGYIYNENASGPAYSSFAIYNLEGGAKELNVVEYYFTYPDYDETIRYYYNKTAEMDPDSSEEFTGTETDFFYIQQTLSESIATREITPLS